MMAEKYQLEKSDSGMHFITLGKSISDKLTKDGNRRVICTLNGSENIHCAVLSKKEGGYFVNIGLKFCKKLTIREGSVVTADFQIDTSKYQFDMPEELEEVLNTDPKANEIFQNLTAGKQRSLIYLVAQVKSSEKKIERALKISQRIKDGVTSPRLILK